MSPGERIVIALPDCPDCVYAFLGGMKYGTWPVLVSNLLSETTYRFILNDSLASALITVSDTEAGAGAHRRSQTHPFHRQLRLSDRICGGLSRTRSIPFEPPRYCVHALHSGSTGNPKGVPHRHGDMPFTADTYGRYVLNASEEDVCFSASKLFFAYGLGNSISFPFRAGAAVVLNSGKSTPAEVFRIISSYRPSIFFGVPTLYNMMVKMLDETTDLESIHLCVSAGEALPAATYRR